MYRVNMEAIFKKQLNVGIMMDASVEDWFHIY